jgi:hypothetical protein
MSGWSWIAIKDADAGAVLQRLGLTLTGQIDWRGEAGLACAETPGWVVVTAQTFDYFDGLLEAFATEAEMIAGQCWDTAMYSAARGYSAGAKTWSVVHDPDAGRDDISVEGSAPGELAAIRDRLMREQAEHADEQVDYIYGIPTELAAALCGYSPEGGVAPQTVLRVIEPLRSGKAGERQAHERALREALAADVTHKLFPLAESLGFEPAARHPALQAFYRFGASQLLVRRRGEWSDCVEIVSDLSDGAPRVGIEFFVRRGDAPRYGRSGVTSVPPPRLTIMEHFQGPKPAQPADIAKAIDQGRDLLMAVDRYLREGAPHPNIRPPIYRDDLGSPGAT